MHLHFLGQRNKADSVWSSLSLLLDWIGQHSQRDRGWYGRPAGTNSQPIKHLSNHIATIQHQVSLYTVAVRKKVRNKPAISKVLRRALIKHSSSTHTHVPTRRAGFPCVLNELLSNRKGSTACRALVQHSTSAWCAALMSWLSCRLNGVILQTFTHNRSPSQLHCINGI